MRRGALIAAAIAGLMFSSLPALSQSLREPGAAFFFDVNYISEFNNGEFDVSEGKYISSGTIAAARLTPYAGLTLGTVETGRHTLAAGIDILKDFGSYGTSGEGHPDNWDLFKEISLYYRYDKGNFTSVAGVFPRFLCDGSYGTAILSDANRIYDSNLEGMLLKYRFSRGGFAEVALDWNGKFGKERREEFNVISYGHIPLSRHLSFSWQGMAHHYANSESVTGVVDDNIINPFFTFDFADKVHLDPPFSVRALSVSAGVYAGYHRDRRFPEYKTPTGLSAGAEAMIGNFGLIDHFYYGGNQVPYYDAVDAAGIPYADNLYMRSLMWRQLDEKDKVYNRLEAFWQPRLGRYTSLKISVTAHFHRKFAGWQQIATLIFWLGKER